MTDELAEELELLVSKLPDDGTLSPDERGSNILVQRDLLSGAEVVEVEEI